VWEGSGAPADVLPEKLTREMISPVLGRVRFYLKVCANDFEAKGTVKTKVTIAPDGRVIDVVVDTGGQRSLEKCVARELKAATFPKTRKGGVFNQTFSY